MTDAAKVIKGSALTFPSDRPRKKLDYIFVSRDIELISAAVPHVTVSDHLPHLAEIEMKKSF